ncbi:MAG: 2,3,4,5-tetrahydropyridine-2,6-dicarboxylate N-succinyltransferase [Francisellaceae bacterium]|jgi:2,3,4,5-tetrahydropyridine-2,6-dicarboxylate N-succinyltransferase|nr:2,3,4,5-tetrahydropyridine-2,6-dicarboxylate N-succinyltransferase [Francisellaceae bacterium]MBT6538255.1 2,3,4,5-tetrahydropyridine-2,6-dicarboxylate N-succinyltransferase [Francisellaceae bacterium]
MQNIDVNLIEQMFEERNNWDKPSSKLTENINNSMKLLDLGEIRVAERQNGDGSWQVNQWVKKAILLYFKISTNKVISADHTSWYDKVPLKFNGSNDDALISSGARFVPPATVRYGSYIAPNTVVMPSYVNIGAYVDSGCMIDTWATIGSCAQIGKNVHISGGTGIGGVLEPLQANPTIIEDDCFIGARSEIVEGVIIGKGSVISMGVFLGQSTKIYDRERDEVTYGKIPPGSVVIPGNLPSKCKKYSLACAVIVKRVDAKTKAKVGINNILREIDIPA